MTTMIDSLGIEIKSTGNIKSTINNLNKLSTSLTSVKNASGGFDKLNNSLNKTSSTANTLKKVFNFGAIIYGLKQLTSGIATSVNSINDYIENMNLFRVSMGEFYEEAKDYADLVQSKMGIDSSEWMRGQGVFMSMATGFGLANEQAYQLSKGMTELSYDMSSFYNIPITEALTKMRSALAGEIEPLRALGISLTEATLKEFALAKGITKSVEAMTEGEKAQLRYVAIVEKATAQGVIGDFARTLESPANAIRILQQQFTLLGRSIGSVFLPIIAQVMPYVQAFVKVLTNAISKLAVLVGFEMPKWDASSWESGSTGVSDTATALGDATAKAKEYKKSLQGFDELNIIPAKQESSSGSGASGGTGGDLGLDIKSVWNESMLASISTKTDEIVAKFQNLGLKIKEAFNTQSVKDFVMVLGSLGAGLGGLAIVKTLASSFKKLGGTSKLFKPLSKFVATIVLNLQALIISFKAGGISGLLSTLGAGISSVFSALAPAMGIVLGVASVVYVLWENFDKVLSVAKEFIQRIALKEKFEGIKTAIEPLMTNLSGLKNLFTLVGSVLLTVLQPAIMVVMGVFNALVNVIRPIITIVNGILQVFSGLGTFLVGVFTGNLEQARQGASTFGTGVSNIFTGMVNFVTGLVGGFVSGIVNYFIALYNNVISGPITNLKNGIANAFSEAWNFAKGVWNSVATWFNTYVVQPVGNFFTGMWNGFVNAGKNAWEGIKSVFSSVGTFFSNTFKNAWQGVVNIFSVGGQIFTNIKNGIVSAFKSVVNQLIKGLNWVISQPFNGINTALRFVRDIKILGMRPFSSIKTISVPSIPLLANGGMPDTGQMFIARESGPELVGQIGNRTTVANNEQIISGISQGVYEAMMRANGSGKDININATFQVDSKAFGEAFIKYHNGMVQQKGASPLMI